LSHEPGQVFVPTKNTLDAASVYVKTDVGQTAQVKAEIIGNTGSAVQTIASKTQTVSNTQSWVLFDFPDVAMPTGIYALTLVDADDAPGATPDASNQPSSGTNSTNPSQKGSSPSKTTNYADIFAQHNPTSSNANTNSGINSNSQPTSPLSGILFFLVRLAPILAILFIGLVLFIAWLIIFRRKKESK